MARIELSNIGGGGGTTLSLTTTGTSGAATLAGSVLNIPVYQGQLTLTTTGTSGAATLSGDILNIPQYSGGGGTPAGSAGQVQFNSTPAGSFAASANLAWDNTNVRLNIGAPSAPTGRLNIRGGGTISSTVNLRLTDSSNTEIFRINDNGDITTGNGSTAQISINGTVVGASNRMFITSATAKTPELVYRPGTGSSDMPAFQLIDSPTSATGSNVLIFGRGGTTLPSTGVSYLGSLVAGNSNANSYDFGFYTSSVALGRFEGLRYFCTGNLLLQNGGTMSDAGYKLDVISASSTHAARFRAPNESSGTDALRVQNSNPFTLFRVEANGKITYWATNTAAGTTGAQTINRPSGTVNFGIGASSLVVTNSLCTTSSIVFATVRTNDATAYIKNVVPAAGSFTINLGAAATAETSVGFFIIN